MSTDNDNQLREAASIDRRRFDSQIQRLTSRVNDLESRLEQLRRVVSDLDSKLDRRNASMTHAINQLIAEVRHDDR